jgi:formylglycine-generating enzyme required for sulfatase activity
MQTHRALGAFRGRLAPALTILALVALAAPAGALAKKSASPVLTFKVMEVGAPGNPAAAIVPFTNAIYRSCEEAPKPKSKKRGPKCMTVGGVGYEYGIGKLEVTVGQWVTFLNTADPRGRNRHRLYSENESGAAWPRFGQINFNAGASVGNHYSAAAPEWVDKPYGFANFLRSARFANSLYNGKLLSKSSGVEGPYSYTSYRVRLSPETERGMYDMRNPKTTRTKKKGFVIPSQDEWIKAAYYDPTGHGTYSYWQYPTNPGQFGSEEQAPKEAALNPATGDVTNASIQPLAIYHNPKATAPAPSWCPSNQTAEACAVDNPLGLPAEGYEKAFQGSLGTVGQAGTLSPWGTLDQGGNAVEWTDTITAPPFGVKGKRVWRRLHGGIANAPAYQLWLSAVGLQPQDNTFFTATYPWLGLRIAVVGDLKLGKR